MFRCGCGRSFVSYAVLTQHRRDKQRNRTDTACQSYSASKASESTKISTTPLSTHRKRDRWMWRNIKTLVPFHVLAQRDIEPCLEAVSSNTTSTFVCSYSWQHSKKKAVRIPGIAPIWRNVSLPVIVPPDSETLFTAQNMPPGPRFPFEPLFRAAEMMNQDINFMDVDIVTTRNSLRKLLAFCSGSRSTSFRVDLSMIHDTLFIERCEKSPRAIMGGAPATGYGFSFEKVSTTLPQGGETCIQYHRALKYMLGELNCVVDFEIDAFYQGPDGEGEKKNNVIINDATFGELASKTEELNIGSGTPRDGGIAGQLPIVEPEIELMPQSAAAEIKTSLRKYGPHDSCLPQMWFGRTPWLIRARHTEGTFDGVIITKAGDKFTTWENKHQVVLKKMVSLLSQLREAVKTSGSKRCIAIYEKNGKSQDLNVFVSVRERGALPGALISKFWSSKGK
ncbi:hypothetical protein F5Y03DRAFT_384414 [Xylaria venustula]|nr:hypothetical protein F5Y03DRAFT_384414 [Xylaria venustula]